MTFSNAMKTLPGEWLKFSGTATRSEFLWKIVIMFGVNIIYGIVMTAIVRSDAYASGLNANQEVPVLIIMALTPVIAWFAYSIPLSVRRLKDTGVSGWWYLGVVILTAVLSFTWILAWLGGLINLAFIVYLIFMPTRVAPAIENAEVA